VFGQESVVAWVGHGDAAQGLDPLGHEVDELGLFLVVLVEQQVQLVEGVAPQEPVVFLVQAGQIYGVGQDMVEQLAALEAGFVERAIGSSRNVPNGCTSIPC
jgi:hypothetical protein